MPRWMAKLGTDTTRLVIHDPRPVGAFVFDKLAAPSDGVNCGICPEASYW